MNQDHIAKTRAQLGELGAMSDQTQRAERQILERAEVLLSEAERRIEALRPKAVAGDAEASRDYQEAIEERGRLNIVIAQAQKNLS